MMTLADYEYLRNPTLQFWLVIAGLHLGIDITLRLRRRSPLSIQREVHDIVRLITILVIACITSNWLKALPVTIATMVLVTLYIAIYVGLEAARLYFGRHHPPPQL
jgi:hypothetical protein